MAKRSYSVKEKVKHYEGVIANAQKTQDAAAKAQKQANRLSYAAGYNKAVEDCRAALKTSKKK